MLALRAPLRRWWRDDGLVLAACVAFTIVLAWRLGQEVGWDLRNYHFYVPHLLIHGRFAQDVEPAGVQTYFNPLLDLPFYVAVRLLRLRPIVVGLGLAAVPTALPGHRPGGGVVPLHGQRHRSVRAP